jgi:hypothetical protein
LPDSPSYVENSHHFATLPETERYRFGPKNAMKAIVKVD